MVLALRIGVDVGGTFTDIVALDGGGRVYFTKTPSTPADQGEGVVNGIRKMLALLSSESRSIARVAHGTTVATNTLLERTGAPTALLTTAGFRDVLHIGRQTRPSLYDLRARRPDPLVPRRWRREVPERTLAGGEVSLPLDQEAVAQVVRELQAEGVRALAICFLHSYANPANEQRAAAVAREHAPDVPVSVSSDILPELREFERMNTTVLNAYVQPVMDRYISRLSRRLADAGVLAPLMVMQSSGGMMSAAVAAKRSVHTLLSGPAGGVLATVFLSRVTGERHFITTDVGGTSFDVAVVENGEAVVRSEGEIEGYPVKFPHIDIHTIGAGGGSIAWIDKGGALRVGPKSAGAVPGPACYGRGGEEPTVTDAHLALGRVSPRLLGGELRLDVERARAAVARRIAGPLGMSVERAAEGILRVVNAGMAQAIRVTTVERGLDPRRFALLPFGGAGPLHGSDLCRDLGLSRMLVPVAPGNFSAFGLLAAPVRHDEVRTCIARQDQVDLARMEGIFAALEAAGRARLAEEGIPPEATTLVRQADLRYYGQAFEITVPAPSWDAAVAAFHAAHERRYGFRKEQDPVEVVNLRLTALGKTAPPRLEAAPLTGGSPAPREARPVYFAGAWVETPVYHRDDLKPGQRIAGPAVIEELGSTTVLSPGDAAEVDAWQNIAVQVGGR